MHIFDIYYTYGTSQSNDKRQVVQIVASFVLKWLHDEIVYSLMD